MLISILSAVLGLVGMFFAQGYAVLFASGLTKVQSKVEQFLSSFALSIAMIPFTGLLLDYTIGVTPATTSIAILSVTVFFGAIGHIRFSRQQCSNFRIGNVSLFLFQIATKPRVSLRRIAFVLVIAFVVFLSLTNWQKGITVHSVDVGTHVFWAKTIQTTGHLPDYRRIEPLDEPYKFVFGPHLLLADFSYVTGLSVETYYWVPLVLMSTFILVGVLVIATRISGSIYAGIIGAVFFATAFHPGGYIQRGNMPDIIGYFMFISALYFLLLVFDLKSGAVISFGLVSLSILYYHQYATIMAPLTVLLFLLSAVVVMRNRLKNFLIALFRKKETMISLIIIAGLMVLTFSKLEYVLMRAPTLLQSSDYSGQWRSWVVPLYDYPLQFGGILFVMGLFGILICARKHENADLILLSWASSLLILSNAPLLGVGLPEPYRFLWRLTEPLSVASGVAGYFSISSFMHISELKIELNGNCRIIPKKSLRLITCLSVTTVTLLLAAQIESAFLYPRYEVSEPFFEADKQISEWLAQNSDSGDTIALNVDIDNTATWVQAFSMNTRFLYKVDAGISFAPSRYKKIYQDMAIMFAQPSSTQVLEIVNRYNISYVVAHDTDVSKFELSPFFRRVYRTSEVAIYAPLLLASYGEVTKITGWKLPTEDGKKVLLCTTLEITFSSSNSPTLIIPIYSHVTEPKTPDTSLNVFLDGVLHSQVFIPQGNITNPHLNYTEFWPSLTQSGVGQVYYLRLSLESGTHVISMIYTSDIDFEIYVEDLKALGIAISVNLPEPT